MRAGRSSGSLVGVFGMLSGKVLFLVGLAIGADSFAPSSVTNTPRRAGGLRHVSSRAPTTGLSAAKCAMTDEHKKAFDPSARGAVRPGTDVVSLLTKYAWGQQSPGIDLPYPIAPGTPPEAAPMVTQEHLDTLARDGVVHIKGVLSDEWVKYLRDITDWQIANPHIWAVPGIASNLYDYIQVSHASHPSLSCVSDWSGVFLARLGHIAVDRWRGAGRRRRTCGFLPASCLRLPTPWHTLLQFARM